MVGDEMDVDKPGVIRSHPEIIFNQITNEGVPAHFKSSREITVQRFYDMLFPEKGVFQSLIFIKAPPCSGKTGFAQLLYNKLVSNENRSVVYLMGHKITKNEENVEWLFENAAKYSIKEFMGKRTEERVIILDEAQCTYNDDSFWASVKVAIGQGFGTNFRLILIAAYGSLNIGGSSYLRGTPLEIPTKHQFGLNDSIDKPGISLKFNEFEEMIKESPYAIRKDLIWTMCADHMGIASSILNYLDDKLKNLTLSEGELVAEIERLLFSKELLLDTAGRRGMPTLNLFSEVISRRKDLHPEVARRLRTIMDRVAMGDIVELKEKDAVTGDQSSNSPNTSNGITFLIAYGLLHLDPDSRLQFASQMHLKVWLHSSKNDSIPLRHINTLTPETLIEAAVGRLSASRLSDLNSQNNAGGVRERQLQMMLYLAIISFLPNGIMVTPEWRTADKKGFVDLVIRNGTILWFFELLVDGIEAKEHEERFKAGGKYSDSLIGNAKYLLVDFRQKVYPRSFRPSFMYVQFSADYSQATINLEGNVLKTITLIE